MVTKWGIEIMPDQFGQLGWGVALSAERYSGFEGHAAVQICHDWELSIGSTAQSRQCVIYLHQLGLQLQVHGSFNYPSCALIARGSELSGSKRGAPSRIPSPHMQVEAAWWKSFHDPRVNLDALSVSCNPDWILSSWQGE